MRLLTIGLGLGGLLFLGSMMPAKAIIPEANKPSMSALVKDLSETKTAPDALQSLIDSKDQGLALEIASDEEADISARGWAVVALSKMPNSDESLQTLSSSSDQLVATWAWAARIASAKDLDAVSALATQVRGRPALQRPITERTKALLSQSDSSTSSLIALSTTMPQLVAGIMDSAKPDEVVEVMFEGRDDTVRRQAAAIAASMATQRGKADQIATATLEILTPNAKTKRPPWDGGALFIPGLNWDRKEAKELVASLTAWGVIAHERKWTNDLRPIQNNLNSVSLLSQAGVGRTFANSQAEMESLHVRVAGQASLDKLKRSLK